MEGVFCNLLYYELQYGLDILVADQVLLSCFLDNFQLQYVFPV